MTKKLEGKTAVITAGTEEGWRLQDDSPRETLANLSISDHLRGFPHQPVADVVQCCQPCKPNKISNLR